MEINQELITLSEDFSNIGTVTASITSLDERGRSVVVLRQPHMGSEKGKSYSLYREKFLKYYEFSEDGGCFSLFRLKEEYKKEAQKHIRAMEIFQ